MMLPSSIKIHGTPDILIDSGAYELVSVATGGRTWRRDTVEGRYQHGRALLGAVLATDTLTVALRVRGTSWTQVQNRLSGLISAVSRPSYTITETVDGAVRTFKCEPADVSAPLDKFKAMALMQDVVLSIPTEP